MITEGQRAKNLKAAFAEHDIPWPKSKTLFWHETGPLVTYVLGSLRVSNLNPEKHIQWRMSKMEMFKLGCRCILCALGR
jgi:hypothetical protein